MSIKKSYCMPTSIFLIISITMLVSLAVAVEVPASTRMSSAYKFDPDYPIGTPPIKGGTGYVTEATDGDGWHTDGGAIGFAQQCTDAVACKNAGVYELYHPGEDWNYESGTAGQPVYAIAYGTVFDTRAELFGDKSGYGSGIVIEHRLPGGQKIYSVYEHITTSLSIGDPVYQGQTIGSVASITKLTPHLHFEIRTTLNKKDWYPNDKGRGYYSSQEKIYADGFIDPSDFIDFHRGSTNTAVAAFQLGSLGMPGFGNPMLPSPTSEDYSNSNPPEVTHPGVITVVNRPEGYPPGGNSGWVPCV